MNKENGMNRNISRYLKISDEVRQALEEGLPVVSLESTIISHGMPYPDNLTTAAEVEKIVRKGGAVPATIAILEGRLTVGLSENELEILASRKDVEKVSRRDIPYVAAKGIFGATTVAATMIISEMAGIDLFVTGGIGGVHRGAGESFDISADLQELAETPVAVVCAGAKSILDIGLTLEYLETYGVPVVGYGTDRFPAFFTRDSGYPVPLKVSDAAEAARIFNVKKELGLRGGMVIANPVPAEFEMDSQVIDSAIEKALDEMSRKGISGKAATPFLLDAVKNNTGSESLKTNIQLVYNNASVGAAVASEMASQNHINFDADK